jgi:MFS family permease
MTILPAFAAMHSVVERVSLTVTDTPSTSRTSASEAEQAYNEQIRRDLPRNYATNLLHGMLGQTGFRLIHAPTFLPAFIYILSGSELAVGLALAAQHFGAASSSILGATMIEHRKKVIPIGFVIGGLMRLQVLGLALSGLFLEGNIALIAACTFLGLFGFFNGMQAVIFNYMMSKVIPLNLRGRLTGLRNFLAGVTASAVAYLGGQYFIETNALGNGYSATFLTAFILTSLGLGLLAFIREPEPPQVRTQTGFLSRLKDLPALMRSDPSFTRFFLARSLGALATIAVPFYVLYAGREIGLSGTNLGILSLAFLLCQTATNLGWGALADRFGNRFVFIASLATWILSTILLFFGGDIYILSLVFAGLGAGLGGFQISSQNMVLEFGDRQDLPMRIAISNAGNSLMMGVGPLMGGIVALYWSYTAVFGSALVFMCIALLMVAFFIDEPRNRS